MKKIIQFLEVGPGNQKVYCVTGRLAYTQHYTHLWVDSDPTPYISASFTPEVVSMELKDPLLAHFILEADNQAVGIMKFRKHSGIGTYTADTALLLEKLYLLNSSRGQGIGSKAIEFAEAFARNLGKSIIWLDTMQEGPALGFYLKNGFSVVGEKMLHYSQVHAHKKPMFILAKSLRAS